ncbi:MAG: lysophospholipid acyltransferase family protein [Verrucomicrobiota bacterium]
MISRLLAKLIFALIGKLRVLRAENSAIAGPYLLAANHISHFDPPLLSVATRRKIDWMAMADLFRSRIFSAWARSIGTFSTDRERPDRASVKNALTRLKQGRVIGIFPEAGLRDGERSVLNGAPIDSGVAALAQMEGVPILPCVILGSDRLYNPQNWRPFCRVTVWVGFGEPIIPPGGMRKREARLYLEHKLCAALQDLCAEMRAHFSLNDDDMPQPPQQRIQE